MGIIGSLGVRRDASSVSLFAPLVSDSDPTVATAAAAALGAIRTADAARALQAAKPSDANVKRAADDALLARLRAVLLEP